MSVDRRTFLATLGAVGVSGAIVPRARDLINSPLPRPAGPGVVVVGGGMAGVSAAKYLRMWSGGTLQVTLVETNPSYTSNIMSNLVLTGQRTLPSLSYSYAKLASSHGVTVVRARATSVDTANRTVGLSNNSTLNYDRLVLAPGLVFDALPGLTEADYTSRVPHAWQAGPQTTLLHDQLRAMPAAGKFVMTIPLAPYRCPPGPYERASVIAAWLKANKPGATVTVLDANPKIMAEPLAFTESFDVIHKGLVHYVPNATVTSVDPVTRTISTTSGSFRADVLNPIPPHRAGAIAQAAGVVNVAGRWAGVSVLSYESTAVPRVHVIGDAIGTTQPKSGHMANAQAKVLADAILRLRAGQPLSQGPATSSACYSPITLNTASWLTGVFQYDQASQTMKPKSIAEAPSISAGNYQDMSKWFNGLMSDTFN